MTELKELKKEHKKLATTTKKTIKKRLNDRTSDSWKSLRDLKKLKLVEIFYLIAAFFCILPLTFLCYFKPKI